MMKPIDEQHQGTCQDSERLPNLTINHLPAEVLLAIFDSYRQDIEPYSYDYQWKEKYGWFNLAHVCGKWRTIMFASSSLLNLGITMRPEQLGHIKTFLSGPLPIFIIFKDMYEDITGTALWRMRATLKRHHDRIREITFQGASANFDKFFKKFSEVTKCAFPMLESISLHFNLGDEPKLIDTFLEGTDLSYLHLRRLRLSGVSLASISGLLSSATSLTNLCLLINSAVSPSLETFFLACLQGMPYLRHLDLFILSSPHESPSQLLIPKDIAPLSKLTRFLYVGSSVFLNALMAGLSAPSLRHIMIEFFDEIWLPILQVPRFMDEIGEHYHTAKVSFLNGQFRLRLLTQSEYANHCDPRFELASYPSRFPESIIQIIGALSARLTTLEKLCVTFDKTATVPWRRFLRQFPSIKALRTKGEDNYCIARALFQDHEESDDNLAFFPALEEIELDRFPLFAYRSQRGRELAAFRPFISARQQAGRPVKVFFGRNML